jgi:hypothetical protein
MKRKHSILVFAIVLAFVEEASAHGFALHVSTPVSPPAGYELISLVTLLSLVMVNIVLFKALWLAGWIRSIGISLLGIGIFSVSFYFFGAFCTILNTAPPPGLGLRHPVFWGFGWDKVGIIFLGWNILGTLFLLGCIVLLGRLRRKLRIQKVLVILALNIGIYLLGVVPYIATGALTHGWAGSHIQIACDVQLKELIYALSQYAEKNDHKIPVGESLDELVPKLVPYMKRPKGRSGNPIHLCPLGCALEKLPKPYVWNKKFIGDTFDVNVLPEKVIIPIVCPYHDESLLPIIILKKKL